MSSLNSAYNKSSSSNHKINTTNRISTTNSIKPSHTSHKNNTINTINKTTTSNNNLRTVSNGGGGGLTAALKKVKNPFSVDDVLQHRGKNLNVGEQCRIRLFKGPDPSCTADPVDTKAPPTTFPLMAKFPVASVVRPIFTEAPWNTSRLYQQDIPKPVDDSDEENDDEKATKKGRWRYNRNQEGHGPRQWILQEQVDFLETMVARREKKQMSKNSQSSSAGGDMGNGGAGSSSSAIHNSNAISTRYEGVPEHSTSHYALIRIERNAPSSSSTEGTTSAPTVPRMIVQLLPPMATITFQQPSARRSLTLSQAEQVIQDQRMGIRSMLGERTDREKLKQDQLNPSGANDPNGNNSSQSKKVLMGGGFRLKNSNIAKSAKDRLLKKLKAIDHDDDIDEADDVMGDVAFRSRKGAGAARRELLTTLGDGLTVSDDGVIGGTNDAAFGGKRRFGKIQTEIDKTSSEGAAAGGASLEADGFGAEDGIMVGGAGGGGGSDNYERGADGAAMADDFYTRDVGAEYEELDYDAADQFDDDDVDLGEGEVMIDENNNFGAEGANEDDDDDDDDSDNDNENDAIGGAEGLASVAGFKALLAKARGEATSSLSSSIPGSSASSGLNQQQQGTTSNGEGMGNDNNNSNSDGKIGSASGNSNITNNNIGGGGTINGGPSVDGKSTLSSPDQHNKANILNSNKRKRKKSEEDDMANDHFSKIVAAAELANENAKKKLRHREDSFNEDSNTDNVNGGASSSTAAGQRANNNPSANTSSAPAAAAAASGGIRVDENGLRIITLQAVQKEIWLNHGSITFKRLMKIFNVSRKSTEVRQNLFRDIVKELCTMKTDPIKGNMLVLKQHYSNMG